MNGMLSDNYWFSDRIGSLIDVAVRQGLSRIFDCTFTSSCF